MTLNADWRNPVPTLAETGLDPAALAALAGDRMLLFSLPPCTAQIPYRGQLKTCTDVIFRGAAQVVPATPAAIRARLVDFAGYTSLIPNTTRADILERSPPHTLAEYLYTFKLSVLTLHTHLRLRHTEEADGSLSACVMDGDAAAGVSRWQVLPLDARRSLVVFLDWADIASRNPLLQMLLRAQPDLALAAPYGAAFVAMDAIRQACSPPPTGTVARVPVLPAFPRMQTQPLLAQLAAAGPVVLVDPGQWVQCDDGRHLRRFVTVGNTIATPLAQAWQHLQAFERYPEFSPLLLKAVPRSRGEQQLVDWQVGIGLGFFSLGIQCRLAYTLPDPHVLRFRREAGDLADIDGEWDWQAQDAGRCFGSLCTGFRIGEQPPLVLRVARTLPHYDVLAGLYMGLTSMHRLQAWLPAQDEVPVHG